MSPRARLRSKDTYWYGGGGGGGGRSINPTGAASRGKVVVVVERAGVGCYVDCREKQEGCSLVGSGEERTSEKKNMRQGVCG